MATGCSQKHVLCLSTPSTSLAWLQQAQLYQFCVYLVSELASGIMCQFYFLPHPQVPTDVNQTNSSARVLRARKETEGKLQQGLLLRAAADTHLFAGGVSEGRHKNVTPEDKTVLFSRQTQRAKFLTLEKLQSQTLCSVKVTVLPLKTHTNSELLRLLTCLSSKHTLLISSSDY